MFTSHRGLVHLASKTSFVFHRGTDEAQAINDEFFVDLPEDFFSPEEELLRTAIRDYLDGFVGKDPPTMSMTCQEKGIQDAQFALLPQGVSLKEWMEKRVGEEFDFAPCASGQCCIGYSGELDHDAIANYHPYAQRLAHSDPHWDQCLSRGQSPQHNHGTVQWSFILVPPSKPETLELINNAASMQ